jgi:3-hydroxybutyryl-CoA dehydratase
MSSIRKKTVAGLVVGETFVVTRTFSKNDTSTFADITRDYNPVHFEPRFVAAKKFDRPICHGLLVAGMITEIGGQIGWLASGMAFDFKKPVYFEDTVTCRFTITAIDARLRAEAEAVFENQHGETVINARISGILPNLSDKKVMQVMMDEGDPTNPYRAEGLLEELIKNSG